MSGVTLGLIGFVVLLILMALRVPIGLAMLTVGAAGAGMVMGTQGLLNTLNTAAYEEFASYSLSIIPLFLLMAQFATRAGLSSSLFNAARVWAGHRRGGVAVATIGACGGFGAVCGSSLATAATMTQVALPEMRKAGYDRGLATGTLAAGGTLGILVPPSVVLVIYAILANQNIAKLFTAALLPALLAMVGYALAINLYAWRYPDAAPLLTKAGGRERFRSVLDIWPVVLIFGLVIGGIYAGIFTPTEGAGVGAASTGLLAWARGGLNMATLRECMLATAAGTGMIFFIVFGAATFNTFLALTQVPQMTAVWVGTLQISPWIVLGCILATYLILGCVMDSLSMILLTVPIFYPVIVGLDFGLTPEETGLWFGILALLVVELGMITPPVGLNLFIINSMARDVPMIETIRGVLPFVAADVVRVVVLVAFPSITLVLVRLLH